MLFGKKIYKMQEYLTTYEKTNKEACAPTATGMKRFYLRIKRTEL